MIKIAIVDDDDAFAAKIEEHILAYAKGTAVKCEISRYSSGLAFLMNYTPVFDVAFIDVEMPHINGIETARVIRKTDEQICIVFVTAVEQYAVQGYSVSALDYALKPITYDTFSKVFERVLRAHKRRKSTSQLAIKQDDQIHSVNIPEVLFVSMNNHYLYYHLEKREYKERGVMKEVENTLVRHGFSRCSNGFIVNLSYIESMDKTTVIVAGQNIPISRQRRKKFQDDYMSFLRNRGA